MPRALNFAAKSRVTLFAGKSGTGKTTGVCKYLVADRKLACRFLFDPEGEYEQRFNLPAAETVEELHFATEDGFCIFDPHTMFPGNLPAAFEFFCGFVFEKSSALAPRRSVLVVDEAWKYCSPATIPAPLAQCIQTGRKRNLESIFATQRPNKLNEAILNEVTELVCFQLRGRNALKALEETYDIETDRIKPIPYGSFLAFNITSGREMAGRLW